MTHPVTLTAPAGTPFIDVVRDFDAPLADVYRAWSEPELVKNWLGPRRYDMVIEQYDVRTGGSWAYEHRAGDEAYGFHGVFHNVTPLESITQTFEFAGAAGHVSLETATFSELGDGGTRVSIHAVYQSIEARDAMVSSGMEGGMTEGFERLDEVLAQSLATPSSSPVR